jgi:hypothetical protein
MTNFDEIQKAGKENMDAAVKAVGLLTKSAQTVATENTDFAKKTYEAGAAHVEKLLAVKAVDKAIELNTDFVKASYEAFVAQATKVSTMYTDMVKELSKPVEAAFAKAKTAATSAAK